MTSVPATGRDAVTRARRTFEEAARTLAAPRPRSVLRLGHDVWLKANRDRVLGLAAENAFMAVLTLFPGLIAMAAVLGQLGRILGADTAARVEHSVLSFLDRMLTSSAAPAVDTARDLFGTKGSTLTFATLLALGSLATAFAGVVNTVTIAYDVVDPRGWWNRRWLGLQLGIGSVVTGAVMVTLIVLGPVFGPAERVVHSIGLSAAYAVLWSVVRWPVAFLALVAWATTLDHLCPNRPHRWRSGLPGGLLSALLWLAASVGFNLYLTRVVPHSPVLGALGGGLILMTWFYLLCLSLLLGAELNAILLARRAARAVVAAPPPGPPAP